MTTARAFVLYALASILLFGRDVVVHPAARVLGDAGADKTLTLWSLLWWPSALADAANPLDVDVAWAPHGYDLGLGTAGGGLALLAAPVTALAGPIVTYNLLALLAPTSSATIAYALAHRLTGRDRASLVAGWVFGFSSYLHGHLVGHLPLASAWLVPLAPLLVILRIEGSLGRTAFVAALAAMLAAQFLVLPQLFVAVVLVGSITLLVGLRGSPRPPRIAAESGAALLGALVLVSPILVYAATSEPVAPARSAFSEAADALGPIIPSRRIWFAPPHAEAVSARFTATGAENGSYLGLPFLVLAALGARHGRAGRTTLVAGLAAAALALGTRVKVSGSVVAVGPWALLEPLPLLGSATPARYSLFVALAASVLVAYALATPSRVRWALAATGIAMTVPNPQLPIWSAPVERPAFFASGADERHLGDGETVLVLPYGPAGWSMLWQAEAQFRFRLVGGHFGVRVTPHEQAWRDVYAGLGTGRVDPQRLRRFLSSRAVDVVVIAPGTAARARRAVEAAIGGPTVRSRDALVYRVRRHGGGRGGPPASVPGDASGSEPLGQTCAGPAVRAGRCR